MITATHAHIVTIRRGDVIEGHQLRIDGGGAGKSRYFSSGKHGGPEQALQAARQHARDLGLPPTLPPGGNNVVGRLSKLNTSGVAGIRFTWVAAASGPILRVVATWQDRRGKSRHTSYSVEHNGLDGALDKAIIARISCGAPLPDRALLMRRLRVVYRSGAPAPGAA